MCSLQSWNSQNRDHPSIQLGLENVKKSHNTFSKSKESSLKMLRTVITHFQNEISKTRLNCNESQNVGHWLGLLINVAFLKKEEAPMKKRVGHKSNTVKKYPCEKHKDSELNRSLKFGIWTHFVKQNLY